MVFAATPLDGMIIQKRLVGWWEGGRANTPHLQTLRLHGGFRAIHKEFAAVLLDCVVL